MSEARYKVIKGSQSAHCCFEWTVVDTTRKAMYTASGFEAVCECFDEIDADKIVGSLNSSQSRLSEAVKVLQRIAANYEDGATFSGTQCADIASEFLATIGEEK